MKLERKQMIFGVLLGGAFATVMTVGVAALASPGGRHGDRFSPEKMEQHLTEMATELNLSEAQETQIRTIMQDARERGREIKKMPRGEEKFSAFRDLRFATEDQIYANLSCAQREQLRLLKREHKAERMQERWEHRQTECDD